MSSVVVVLPQLPVTPMARIRPDRRSTAPYPLASPHFRRRFTGWIARFFIAVRRDLKRRFMGKVGMESRRLRFP